MIQVVITLSSLYMEPDSFHIDSDDSKGASAKQALTCLARENKFALLWGEAQLQKTRPYLALLGLTGPKVTYSDPNPNNIRIRIRPFLKNEYYSYSYLVDFEK